MLITDREQIDAIIRECLVCHLALSRDDQPYVLPVSFGYDGDFVYFHTGFLGQKIDYMEVNPRGLLRVRGWRGGRARPRRPLQDRADLSLGDRLWPRGGDP